MKTTAKILTIVFLLVSFTVSAQMNQGQNQPTDQQQNNSMMYNNNMMQGNNRSYMGNMMYGNNMMNGSYMMNYGMCPLCGNMNSQNMPIQNCMWVVRNLPDMKQQLSLSDDQVNKIIDLRTDYTKQQVELTAEMSKNQMKMEKMIGNNPSASEIRDQLMQCANRRVDLGVAVWETAGKMKAVLSSEQKEQLKNMMQDGNFMQNYMMQGNGMQGGMMQNMNYR